MEGMETRTVGGEGDGRDMEAVVVERMMLG